MFTAFLTGFIGGLLNSPHCLGMCGGFPMHLAKSSRTGRVLLRECLFVAGKGFTYVFLGAVAGALGVVVFRNSSIAPFAPALRISAGLVTILFGLLILGFRLPSVGALPGRSASMPVRNLCGGLFASTNPGAAFVLGLGVGFLPCPLPMGLLAVAALSHNIFHGMLLMGGMGLGTAPALLAVGFLGIGLDRKYARIGMNAAGLALVAIGLLIVIKASGLAAAHPCCAAGMPY